MPVGVPADVALRGLAPGTQKQYVDRMGIILRDLRLRRVSEVSETAFLEFAWRRRKKMMGASLDKFRSAMVHFQLDLVSPENCWTQTRAFKRRWDGVLTQAKGRVFGRGGITSARLAQLLSIVSEAKMRVAFVLAYYALLRVGELHFLKGRDVFAAGSDLRVVIKANNGDKTHKAKRAKSAPYMEVRVPGRADLMQVLAARPEDLLFPGWSPRKANALIKQAASHFQWDPDFMWSFHSLRHGRAEDLRQSGLSVDDLRVAGRWRSDRVALHYGASSR